MSFLRKLFGKRDPATVQAGDRMETLEQRISRSFAGHQTELASLPNPRRRAEIITTWRHNIDQKAHDYADKVLAHPKREEITQLEVGAIMQAYLCGVMANRVWIERIDAEQAAYMLGRALRDRLRALGFPLESVNLTIGTVIDESLGCIVRLGIEKGD